MLKNNKNIKANEVVKIIKPVIIGPEKSGKTCLMLQLYENKFDENYLCTIGVDFRPMYY